MVGMFPALLPDMLEVFGLLAREDLPNKSREHHDLNCRNRRSSQPKRLSDQSDCFTCVAISIPSSAGTRARGGSCSIRRFI
jgi:hypothetical protein